MSRDWSAREVDLTVASYFAMFEQELRGEPYNKTAYRRDLLPLLDDRTEAAIEKKHQNISAILIELHAPYISGYKPLPNYQSILFDVVARKMDSTAELSKLIMSSAKERIIVPKVDDILRAIVDPPKASGTTHLYSVKDSGKIRARRIDYLAMEAKNRSTGDAGEEFVRRFETARLIAAHRERLAAKVERVSVTHGDGDGYDILSFEESGRERLIEVKTTRYGQETPFFVTPHELDTSERCRDQYYLYRVFEIQRQPRFFFIPGQLDESFSLSTSEFVARVR